MAATGKRFKPEQIINLLREIDVLTSSGRTIPKACKHAGISEQTDLPESTGEASHCLFAEPTKINCV
jgi:hypothetical protein